MVFVGQKSAIFVILSPNHPTMMGINIIKSKIVGQILKKNKSKYDTMEPLKCQNRTQNPPTCQNRLTMIAKNLRFSKKYPN